MVKIEMGICHSCVHRLVCHVWIEAPKQNPFADVDDRTLTIILTTCKYRKV